MRQPAGKQSILSTFLVSSCHQPYFQLVNYPLYIYQALEIGRLMLYCPGPGEQSTRELTVYALVKETPRFRSVDPKSYAPGPGYTCDTDFGREFM